MDWFVTGRACKVLAPDKIPQCGEGGKNWLYKGPEHEAEAGYLLQNIRDHSWYCMPHAFQGTACGSPDHRPGP